MSDRKKSSCEKCGELFVPTPDEEKLIAAGKIARVCLECLKKEYEGKQSEDKSGPPRAPDSLDEKTDGTKLFRAERFDKDGKLIVFLALPRPEKIRVPKSLVRPKPNQLHVTMIPMGPGAGVSDKPSHVPRTTLQTNLDAFRKRGTPFWVKKVPGFVCAETGTDRIEIPASEVLSILREEGKVSIHVSDGGMVYLHFK